jgi:hypothetical protein
VEENGLVYMLRGNNTTLESMYIFRGIVANRKHSYCIQEHKQGKEKGDNGEEREKATPRREQSED